METPELISYAATAFMLLGYLCRTVLLRAFTFLGCILNMVFALMIVEQSISARSIIISNAIYAVINFIQLFREMLREKDN